MSAPSEDLARRLIAEVVAEHVRPGECLPDAAELAARFGVARETAYAAIRDLEARGLVTFTTDGTPIVNPETEWNVLDPHVLCGMLESTRGPSIVGEYIEARRVLEIIAAGLAAERAKTEELAALSEALARMAAATEEDAEHEFQCADVAFHRALLSASGNRLLELAAEPLQSSLCVARRTLAGPSVRRDQELSEHQRVLAAVAQRNPEAARRAITEHLDIVESDLREYAGIARQRCARPRD